MNTLELDKQLADLRIYANELEAKLQDDIISSKKKPSIPPKKNKAPLPQIPQSCMVKSACEPSYSSRLEYGSRTSSTYSNLVPVKSCIVRNNTARVRSGDVLLYSNLLPPGGTNHVYSNMMMQRNAYGGDSIYGDRDTRSEVSRGSDLGAQSNYSELRRPGSAYPPSSASVNAQDFSTYGGSQTSSTYESLYEPINPRPCSQLSGTSLYGGYVGTTVEPTPEPDDALYCGNCYKCGEKIMGETTGCSAMERIYHIKCFCCQHCGINLQVSMSKTIELCTIIYKLSSMKMELFISRALVSSCFKLKYIIVIFITSKLLSVTKALFSFYLQNIIKLKGIIPYSIITNFLRSNLNFRCNEYPFINETVCFSFRLLILIVFH